jgi:hypothetical protein
MLSFKQCGPVVRGPCFRGDDIDPYDGKRGTTARLEHELRIAVPLKPALHGVISAYYELSAR